MRSRALSASVLAVAVTVGTVAANWGLAVAAPQQYVEELPAVNAPSMLRGYFFAASPIRDPKALGGFGRSGNLPASLDRDVPPNAVSLIALPEEIVPFDSSHRGFRVILANVLWGSSEVKALYSNEFPGAVNREQFSIRQGHTPTIFRVPSND